VVFCHAWADAPSFFYAHVPCTSPVFLPVSKMFVFNHHQPTPIAAREWRSSFSALRFLCSACSDFGAPSGGQSNEVSTGVAAVSDDSPALSCPVFRFLIPHAARPFFGRSYFFVFGRGSPLLRDFIALSVLVSKPEGRGFLNGPVERFLRDSSKLGLLTVLVPPPIFFFFFYRLGAPNVNDFSFCGRWQSRGVRPRTLLFQLSGLRGSLSITAVRLTHSLSDAVFCCRPFCLLFPVFLQSGNFCAVLARSPSFLVHVDNFFVF